MSVCGFHFEPLASIDLKCGACWPDASKHQHVALGCWSKASRLPASETQQQQADVYTLTDAHVHLDVDKMHRHACSSACGLGETRNETDLNPSLESVSWVYDFIAALSHSRVTVSLQMDWNLCNKIIRANKQTHENVTAFLICWNLYTDSVLRGNDRLKKPELTGLIIFSK